MTVRSEIADALDLPDTYRVIDYQTGLDRIEVGQVVVMLYRETVRPAPQHQALDNELSAWVLIPNQRAGTSDDVLDDALDVVLDAIDRVEPVLWTTAERGVWGDTYPGYRITLNAITSKEI